MSDLRFQIINGGNSREQQLRDAMTALYGMPEIKHTTVYIGEQEFALQSVGLAWYYSVNDECGTSGGNRRNSVKYMDTMFKNCVTAPAEVAENGVRYFNEKGDIYTAEMLIKQIESFLRGLIPSSKESVTNE